MKFVRVLIVIAFAVLCACSDKQAALTEGEQAALAQSAEQRLTQLVEQYWEEFLVLNPIAATFYGDNRYNDRLAIDIGPKYLADSLALDQKYLEQLKSIDPAALSGQARLTYDIFKLDREMSIEGYRFPNELLPINQSFSLPSLFAQMGAASGVQPFATVKDYDDWLKRVADFVVWADQAIENMRDGVSRGVVQPRIVMEKVLPQLEAMLVSDPTQSVFYRPVAQFPENFSAQDRQRLTAALTKAIGEQIVPSYRRLHTFVRDDYLPRTRATVALTSLPQGAEWYAYQVKLQTTTNLTPEQIHELGLKEVARIRGEMDRVMQQVGFKGDLAAFFALLRSDPRFYYTTPDDLLNGYRALKDQVAAAAPSLFAIQPKADFEIRAVEEFRAQSAATASYRPATPDGTRPGVFYVNTFDLKSRPRYSMRAVYLHEAVPGHHFQFSIQQELENLPRFRRFGGYTAYSEGWGLYSESLGKELGLYADPYDLFGALGTEIFRAVRLVVDTGIHAKGWSREQAIEYMSANAPVGPADAVSEIERYIANPGQALAYKVGELKLKDLRARAVQKLGDDFDVREFHTQVLIDGALPLDVLEAKLDRWLVERAPT
ncbi:MAG TPA: DUF885 domain-containing protein [Steroidobacteraceae bacterium]